MDRILGNVKADLILNHCPLWHVKATRYGLSVWIQAIVNASFQFGQLPMVLKEATFAEKAIAGSL